MRPVKAGPLRSIEGIYMAKILIVDDAASMRQQIAFVLETNGHQVLMGQDGLDGLEILKQNNDIDLVISDIRMPRMEGIPMIKKMRNDVRFRNLPIIILSTKGDNTLIQQAKELGASGWMVKPFNPPQLLNIINKVLSKIAASKSG